MRSRHTTPAEGEARAARLAWLVSFLATLTLIAILAMARSAQALTVTAPPNLPVPAAFPYEEDEGEGEVEEECIEGIEEPCQEEEAAGAGSSGSEAPRECLLSSARATIFAPANRDKIRLKVRYTTSSPTAVAVEYGLHGAKGSLYLGGDKKRFAKKGILHLTKRLTKAQMAKVAAAKGFTVRLHVLAAPSYCHPFFDRQLNVRRALPNGLAWSQSE